jgi:hypothetical protein
MAVIVPDGTAVSIAVKAPFDVQPVFAEELSIVYRYALTDASFHVLKVRFHVTVRSFPT